MQLGYICIAWFHSPQFRIRSKSEEQSEASLLEFQFGVNEPLENDSTLLKIEPIGNIILTIGRTFWLIAHTTLTEIMDLSA